MTRTAGSRGRSGFSLVELMIVVSVLAILAALVIPKYSDASTTAKSAAAKDQLRSVRMALQRYKLDHGDTYPDIDDLWSALTAKTDKDGTLNPAGDYGPYILSAPTNPYTNSSTVVAFGAGAATDGWEYDATEQPPINAVGFDEATGIYTAP